jgi:hypothetical protein
VTEVSKFAYLVLFATIIVGVSACGGSEPATSTPTTGASSGSSETTVATASDASAEADDTDDTDDIRDVDLDARLSGLEVGLKGTAELVDDNTVRMIFDDGSVAGTDPIKACAVGTSLLDEGMVLIVEYPDGEKAC